MRRLPIFFVLDVSESMAGDPHAQLQRAMESIVAQLRQDPSALETVYISVIAFAGKVGTVVPMVDLMSFYAPRSRKARWKTSQITLQQMVGTRQK